MRDKRSRRGTIWRVLLGAAILVVGATIALRLVTRFTGGPIGMIPGGRLRGEYAAQQDPDWGFTEDVETIAVEVNPSNPLSVTTWVFAHEGELYVAADFFNPFKRWPRLALEDPRVRLRIEGQLYDRTAVRVTDPVLIEELRRAIGEKYDVDPDGLAARVDVWFFRMEPRRPLAPTEDDRSSP